MKELFIDIETFSSADLSKCGVYKYAESNDFEILLFAYSIDGNEVKVVDIASGEKIPTEIINALNDNSILKWAHNASFERVCLSTFLGLPIGTYLNPISWRCSMVLALYNGLPRSLKDIGLTINIDNKKLEEGKELVRYFCMPCKPTKANGNRTRNYYYHDKAKWELFRFYNQKDVEAEMDIINKLRKFECPLFVWEEYTLDQIINDRGILIDMQLVANAIDMDEKVRVELTEEMRFLTNLENPNSVAQQKEWLSTQGLEVETLGKKAVEEYSKTYQNSHIGRMLELRKMLSKSSVKKYLAMSGAVCSDLRVRGMFMFYGARTGRWVSRIVQLQNLPRNEMQCLEQARGLAREGNLGALRLLFEDVPDTLSQLVRTAFVAPQKAKFVVADFAAIEARVLAWLADEKWRMIAFKDNKDIYCESAAQMFKVPVQKHGVNGHLRAKGKIAELALGYGGSTGALTAMGALDMGLQENELKPLVNAWRDSNPNIVKYWWTIDTVIRKTIEEKSTYKVGKLRFEYKSGMLFIHLPSGRRLTYVKPKIVSNQYGGDSIVFKGLDMSKKFVDMESYGPKFVENIVQAIARDLLMNAMNNLKEFKIVAHVHDELIIETPLETSVDFICKEMAKLPSWAEGLILRADGYETPFYKKD